MILLQPPFFWGHHYNPPFCERHQSVMKKCFR
nr:MAG TPA: hypothetical protein [Caudoviricetes sp.]